MKNELWFFVWRKPGQQPYATSICAYYRRDLIARVVNQLHMDWPKIRRNGGRAEKIDVTVPPNGQAQRQEAHRADCPLERDVGRQQRERGDE